MSDFMERQIEFGDWPEDIGERLTRASKVCGEVSLYACEGKVFHE